jgi:hypothetical protein
VGSQLVGLASGCTLQRHSGAGWQRAEPVRARVQISSTSLSLSPSFVFTVAHELSRHI